MPGLDEQGMCDGSGDATGDHCCWVAGQPCPHLVVNGPTGRRYACGLFTELGDWTLVHADSRYQATPAPQWAAAGVVNCGDWWGPNRATWVQIRTAGQVTEQQVTDLARCCYKRFTDTPQRLRQATRAVNRWLSRNPM